MDYIKLTLGNIDSEHICCALSGNKDPQVIAKKNWLKKRIEEGLVFLKANIRGKCFIEYIPSEYAWVPILAPEYMHINCFWVSGSCKGNGYSNELLDSCIKDAMEKGKKGLTVISSPRKMPFLSDPKYLSYKGFLVADTANPHFTLMYLPFEKDASIPKFKEHVKLPQSKDQGFEVYYTDGCPFTAKYVPLIENIAQSQNIPLEASILIALKKLKMLLLLGRTMLCFITEYMSPMKYYPKRNLWLCAKN